jgi:hypothetical protein
VISEGATAVAVAKAGIALADSVADAEALLAQAQSLGQVSAGVAAAKLKAQLCGHLTEKTQETTKNPLTGKDISQLLALQSALESKLQAEIDALELAGIKPSAPRVVPMRRVIG